MCNSNLSSNPCDQICKNKSHTTRLLKPISSMYSVIIHGLTITPFLLALCLWHFIPLYRNQKMFNALLAVELFFHF